MAPSCTLAIPIARRPLDVIHYLSSEFRNGVTTTATDDCQENPAKPVVSFSATVRSVLIPSRNCYPEEIKRRLWMTKNEIDDMVSRNLLEFEKEDWDWRNAGDTSSMSIPNSTLTEADYPSNMSHDTENCGAIDRSGCLVIERPPAPLFFDEDEDDNDDDEDFHFIPSRHLEIYC